ncbi:MAG: hypothetical protein Q4B68_10045, partial [Bacteroidales bacterium]|nr:hypothetical protein [Bacteroidales bacterium]
GRLVFGVGGRLVFGGRSPRVFGYGLALFWSIRTGWWGIITQILPIITNSTNFYLLCISTPLEPQQPPTKK